MHIWQAILTEPNLYYGSPSPSLFCSPHLAKCRGKVAESSDVVLPSTVKMCMELWPEGRAGQRRRERKRWEWWHHGDSSRIRWQPRQSFSNLKEKKSMKTNQMRLCHPPDGSTSPQYKLLCFKTSKKICNEKNTLAFNRDRCCHGPPSALFTVDSFPLGSVSAGNTKGGSITVPSTSCLTSLESAVWQLTIFVFIRKTH